MTFIKTNFLSLLLILILILPGCAAIKYTDISDNEIYRHLVGKMYELKKAMAVTGINFPPGYGPEINIYHLEPHPINWSGPELISNQLIAPGTYISILSVQQGNWGSGVQVTVKIEGFAKEADVDIYMELEIIEKGDFLKEKKRGVKSLLDSSQVAEPEHVKQ